MCDVWLDFLYFLTKKGGRGVGAVVFFFYVFYYNAIRTLDYFLILLLSLNCHLTSLLISYSPPKSQHTPSYLKHPQHDINQPNQHKNHKYHNTSKLPTKLSRCISRPSSLPLYLPLQSLQFQVNTQWKVLRSILTRYSK